MSFDPNNSDDVGSRDSKLRREKLFTFGYREGVIKGRDDVIQNSYQNGFAAGANLASFLGSINGMIKCYSQYVDANVEKSQKKDNSNENVKSNPSNALIYLSPLEDIHMTQLKKYFKTYMNELNDWNVREVVSRMVQNESIDFEQFILRDLEHAFPFIRDTLIQLRHLLRD